MKKLFEAHAAELERLRKKIYELARRRAESAEATAAWSQASKVFFEQYDQLAFPGGLHREFELLRSADENAIEMAISFLEADPWYFRSGYYKEDMLRLLRKVPLTDEQRSRMRDLILKRVRGRPRRETREFCHFATKVTNAEFEEEIGRIAQSSSRPAARYAQLILDCLRSARKLPKPDE